MSKTLVLSALILATSATAALAQNAPYQGAPPPANHTGLTFEANIGFGMLRAAADDGGEVETESALGGLNLGIGGFINPQMALTLRIAGATHSEDGASITQAFGGPSLQYWLSDAAWLGGGIGLGVARLSFDGSSESYSESGVGLDLRAGYTFNPRAKHSFNVSAEITPTFLDGGTFTGIALLFGYQTL